MQFFGKKLIYISNFKPKLKSINGVAKKINNQIIAFEKLGFNVSYTYLEDDCIFLKYDNEKIYLTKVLKKPYNTIKSLYRSLSRLFSNSFIGENIDLVYIRKTSTTLSQLIFFRNLKKNKIKILVEIPVYPYRTEKSKSIASILSYFYDYILNKFLSKKYVDLYVNYNNENKIFGVKAISINNGLNLDEIPIKYSSFNNKLINIGTISSMGYWHAYERVIEGLKIYYSKSVEIDVRFHLIGVGPETEKYKNLTDIYKLQDKVYFYNNLGDNDLNKMINILDIGVIALGIHRKKLKMVSSIKTAEFLARGLPFIYSGIEMGLSGEEIFAKKFSSTDEPININQVIEFYLNIKNNQDIENKMRFFAKKHFTWVEQYKIVFNQISFDN